MKNCPYCKKEMEETLNSFLFQYGNDDPDTNIYICKNHNDIHVTYIHDVECSDSIWLKSNNYELIIDIDIEVMTLYSKDIFIGRFPLNTTINADNFENKVKTYLTFK